MERASRLSVALRADVFKAHRDARVAGTRVSPAGIASEASATGIALEATATRGFDFMEDRPLDARGRTSNSGERGAPRGDKRTAPDGAGGSGRRVASLFELLQELSSPRDQSSTTSRRTRPRATACPPETNSLLGGTSASGKTSSTRLHQSRGPADRHEARGAIDRREANSAANGRRVRSVASRENLPTPRSLYEPARPALRREDDPRDFSSKEAHRVTFAGTRAVPLKQATIVAITPTPTPPAKLLDEQRQMSGSAVIIPSRPKRPTGIQGVGSAEDRRPHRDSAQGATKRVALSNVTPGDAHGENRASTALTASAERSEALPKLGPSVGHAHAAEGESGSEERSSKRRPGYTRELQGGSSLVGAAGRSEERRRGVVGVGRLSEGKAARGRGGGGCVSPAERTVEQIPRVDKGSMQGAPQGGYGAPTGQGGVAVDPWTPQGHTTGMWMWQDEGDILDSKQQGSIESRSQSQALEVQNAGEVRGIRPSSERTERKVEVERQDGGKAAAAADMCGSALMERRDGGLAERETRSLGNGEQEWGYGTGASENAEQEEGDKGNPKKELVRVRGLCHMRGAILALVEWSVVDGEGATFTELSFMLSSALKADWPQQYITFLEERMVFNTEDEAYGTRGEARSNPPSAATEGAESALEVWKPGESTTSRLPA